MKQKPYANDHDERAWGTDPPMGAGLVRIDLYLHRYPSGHDAKRLVHRQYAGGIKHARHEHRGYNHGILRAAAGMAVSYPIIPKILEAFSIKFLLLADLVAQFFLSWICARSQNANILIVCSFAIGFLKGFLMLWFIRYAQKIFSPKNIRSQFYSYFYPFVFGGDKHPCLLPHS